MGLNPLRLLRSMSSDQTLGGRYKVISQLGAGGFGQTFLAEDLHLPGHPRCVVKQLKPQVKDAASFQTARRLFDTEAKVLYQLGNHDQIPRLLAHFEENQEFYLVQELIEGASLTTELLPEHPWAEANVIALLRDVLQALAFVHQQQVIHRDIKPSNLIRRQQDGKIVLIDFGAVKQVGTQLVNTHSGSTNLTISIGTKGYMPNEQLAGKPRFSSDVYAVGMLGIQALTGLYPWQFQEDPRMGEISWCQYAPQMSPELAGILVRMVRQDFRDRYPSAVEALAALEALPEELLVSPFFNEVSELSALEESPEASLSEAAMEESTLVAPTPELSPATAEPDLSPPLEESSFAADLEMLPLPQAAQPSEIQHSSSSLAESSGSSRVATVAISGRAPQLTSRQPWSLMVAVLAVIAGVTFIGVRSLQQSEPAGQTAATNTTPADTPSNASDPVEPNGTQSPVAASPDPAAQATQLLNQADSLQAGEQYQQALALYDQAIALDSNNSKAHAGRCFSLNKLQQLDAAIAACDQALAQDPKNAKALWSKGYALDQQQRHSEALVLYDQAIAIDPNFADAWSNKGTALLRLERPEEAIQALDRAIALKPDLAEAWNSRGVAFWVLQDPEEAIRSIERALDINPNYEDAQSIREQIRQRIGR